MDGIMLIYRPQCVTGNNHWYSHNILIDGEDIVRFIKSMRISWLGHVMRMEDDRTPKAILRRTIGGQRRKRIPRRKWLQDIEDDLKRMGIGDWRWRLEVQGVWRQLVGEDKAHR